MNDENNEKMTSFSSESNEVRSPSQQSLFLADLPLPSIRISFYQKSITEKERSKIYQSISSPTKLGAL